MDKKRPTAKLKKKGGYLPNQPGADEPETSDQSGSEPGSQVVAIPIKPRTYRRARWKNFVRYPALLGIVLVNCSIFSMAVRIVSTHTEITPALLGKLGLVFIIMVMSNLMFLPSIALESDHIEVSDEGLTMQSLLYRANIPWSDVKRVINPLFLKFAIIRTPRFFQLINKRDIADFNELIQTIEKKAEHAPE